MTKNNPCIPTRIRGVDYPSQKAAAKALGLGKNTIARALAQGIPDYAGLGKSKERTQAYREARQRGK